MCTYREGVAFRALAEDLSQWILKLPKPAKLQEGIQMDNISNEIRAKLKRLCPYVGSYIPSSVRRDARKYWQPLYDTGKDPGWFWDDDGDFFQCVLPICDIDAETIDPAGYVAIRPLEGDQYALVFVLCPKWADGFDPSNLIFDTVQEAKHYLDTLLAVDTPEIPNQ
jgi:hypothetical protein